MSLGKLLQPRKIAVVGASEKESSFGGDTCKNIVDNADVSRYYFVNPKREAVFGQKCYPSLSDLPEDIDMVLICTPQPTVLGLLREAAHKGARGAVVYASGYSEVGTAEGEKAQQELTALCRELDISLMGPNCGGYVNYTDSIVNFAFISDRRDRRGSVGLISQSGQICLSAMDNPAMRMSYAISSGNCAVVSMEDYLMFLVDDPNTKVVAMFLEGVREPEKMILALRKAAQLRKPVVVFKVGRSEKGSATAASHTGSLSGADATFDAVFKKFGVIRVNDFQELLSTSLCLATWKNLPEQATVAAMCLSGGETGICADVGDMCGIVYKDFTQETLDRLRAQLPSYATARNPLDMTATLSYDVDLYAEALQTVVDDPNVGVVLIGYTLLHEISDPAIHYMAKGIEKVVQSGKATKPIAMLPFAENSRNPEYLDRLNAAGVPILPPPVYAFNVLRHIMDFAQYRAEEHSLEVITGFSAETAGRRRVLSEYESMDALKAYGIAVPKGGVASSADEAVALARAMDIGKGGRKVALKIASSDIPHKTDAGGVRLNLDTDEAVREAFDGILKSCLAYAPHAAVDGVFVQEMLPRPSIEMIIGVSQDAQFGPQILCGLGGIFVELFKDTALYPAPLGKTEALGMLSSLQSFPLLKGYRGAPPLDIDAVAETLVAVSRFAGQMGSGLLELDINPLFVYPKGQGVCAADALLVLKE